MFKFRRLLCAVLVCAMVGVAYGAARKIKAFTTFNEPAGADGMAIVNYAAGNDNTIFQIVLSDFTPNTVYDVGLVSPGADPDPPDQFPFCGLCGVVWAASLALETDAHGNGTYHIEWPGDLSTYNIAIYLFHQGTYPIPNTWELRALGNP